METPSCEPLARSRSSVRCRFAGIQHERPVYRIQATAEGQNFPPPMKALTDGAPMPRALLTACTTASGANGAYAFGDITHDSSVYEYAVSG